MVKWAGLTDIAQNCAIVFLTFNITASKVLKKVKHRQRFLFGGQNRIGFKGIEIFKII